MFELFFTGKGVMVLVIIFAVSLIILFSVLSITIKNKRYQKKYKEKIIKRNSYIKEKTIDDIKEENRILKKESHDLSKIIHKDNKMIPTLKSATIELLNISDVNLKKEKSCSLIQNINELAVERENTLKKYQKLDSLKEEKELTPTEIFEKTQCIKYLKEKFNDVTIKVTSNEDIKEILNTKINEVDFNTIIFEICENAFNDQCKNILISLSKNDDIYNLKISDDAKLFSKSVISKLGLKKIRFTKNQILKNFSLLQVLQIAHENKASLIINEQAESLYKKSITIIFDDKEHITVNTNRKEILNLSEKRKDIEFKNV